MTTISDGRIDTQAWAEAVKTVHDGKPLWVALADDGVWLERSRALLSAYLSALSPTPEAPVTGGAWDVEEFKVWKGIDPDKPRWHGRGYCCPSWGEAAELMEFLAHNDQTLLLRVSPFPATPAETQADEVGL